MSATQTTSHVTDEQVFARWEDEVTAMIAQYNDGLVTKQECMMNVLRNTKLAYTIMVEIQGVEA